MSKKHTLAWFLFGLGSELQIIASLSFTEVFVFAATPFIFLREKDYMKKNGVMPFFWLSMLVVVGCFVACISNHTEATFVIRGMAVACLLPCVVVVGHWMLRRDMGGFKWALIGTAISSVLCTFVFQKSVEVAMLAGGVAGESAVNAIISGPIYWIGRLNAVLKAIPQGWYLQCPTFVAVGVPLFMLGFSMLTTSSGRSASLGAIGTVAILLIGGKKRETIRRRLCKKFGLWCCIAIIGIFCIHNFYHVSVTNGWLGEDALKKYETQSRGEKSIMSLLLGGRMESFCGLIACVDKPIVGFGPWAMDNEGYIGEYMDKYGTYEDSIKYYRILQDNLALGKTRMLIPCHSYITSFWLNYGIIGLIFWIYVILILIRYLRQDCWAVPQWFMWIAASLPSFFWAIFFSPWANRIWGVVLVVACLMERAVRLGVQRLPEDMEREIIEIESNR